MFKQICLIVLYLLLNVKLCLGQPYEPLLAESNQWHITTCNFGCITDVYYTNGDTIADGLNYKILDGFHYFSRTFLLREELVTKKIYFKKIFPTNNREYLLYDFSLNEGDIFTLYPYEVANPEFLEDCTVLIVKTPSIVGDKFIIP